MLKLYTDGHIGLSIINQLKSRGVDIERCEDIGMKDASDIEHLNYATQNNRTLVTHDNDFVRLDNIWKTQKKVHCGIIRISSSYMGNVGVIVNYLHFLHQAIEEGAASLESDIYNQVLYL